MPTPTMRMLVEKELITPLKLLGRHDWLKWQPAITNPPSTRIQLCVPNDPALLEYPVFLRRLQFLADTEAASLYRLFVLSKTLANGPKVLQPTTGQCEALMNVDVNVSHADYEQPFPSIIVELPADFRRSMTERFEWPCPPFVLLYHDKRTGYLLAFCVVGPTEAGTMNIISPRTQFKTIEKSLRFDCDEDGNDFRQAEVLQRIACNFGLLLTRFGAKDCGPFDAKTQKKQVRRARSSNTRKARRAQSLLDASANQIVFEQDVLFYDTVHSATENPDACGTQKRTHWRRGHFRRQQCGTGRQERRLVFVRPCLINASDFQGDLADTEYRIHSGLKERQMNVNARNRKTRNVNSENSLRRQGGPPDAD
jgi:hypothetical protein